MDLQSEIISAWNQMRKAKLHLFTQDTSKSWVKNSNLHPTFSYSWIGPLNSKEQKFVSSLEKKRENLDGAIMMQQGYIHGVTVSDKEIDKLYDEISEMHNDWVFKYGYEIILNESEVMKNSSLIGTLLSWANTLNE